MNPDKVTIVGGCTPRSRTSLTMQILDALGAPVVGDKWPGSYDALRARVEERFADNADAKQRAIDDLDARRTELDEALALSRQLNPGGFYEVGGVVMRGTRDAETYGGTVLKVMSTGLGARRRGGTPVDAIDTMLLCIRDPRQVALSQTRLQNRAVRVAGVRRRWTSPPSPVSPRRYVREMGRMAKLLVDHWDMLSPKVLVLDDAWWDGFALHNLQAVCSHIGFAPKSDAWDKALALVDPAKLAPKEFPGWTDVQQQYGDVADTLYAALRSMDKAAMEAALAAAESLQAEQALERVSWVDDSDDPATWLTVTPPSFRMFAAGSHGHDPAKSAPAECFRSRNCPHYGRSGETYAIERPDDLGPLTRTKVTCERDNEEYTLEQCMRCWNRGGLFDGKHRGPQRTGGEVR